MLSSRSGILAEAISTLIKTFPILLFRNSHYTFRTHDGRKSNEQRAKRKEQQAKSKVQSAKRKEQRVKRNKQRATAKRSVS